MLLLFQTYRNFRLSVHCLVDGIEAMSNSQFAAALGLFLDAHYYSLYFQEPDLEVKADFFIYFGFS